MTVYVLHKISFARENVFPGYFADSWTPHGMGMAWAWDGRVQYPARAIL